VNLSYLLPVVLVIVIGPGIVTFTGVSVNFWQFSQMSATNPTLSSFTLTGPGATSNSTGSVYIVILGAYAIIFP